MLNTAVNRVDGDGVVLDENFVLLRGPERSCFDLQGDLFGFCDPGGAVGRHFEWMRVDVSGKIWISFESWDV